MHSVSGSTLLTLKICTGPRPLDGAVKLKNADNAVTYCCRSERCETRQRSKRRRHVTRLQREWAAAGSDQRVPQKSPPPPWKLASAAPFDLRCINAAAVVPTERTSGLCVSGRRWQLVLAVGSWPAQLPTEPNCTTAGLLIRLTVTAGVHTHGILRSARQQHGLLRLYAMYIVCQKRNAWTDAGPKKIRDRSGLVLDRPSPEPGTGPVLTLE